MTSMSKTNFKNRINKKLISIALLMLILMVSTGCSDNKKTVVLTMGFNKDEVFKIEDEVCKLNEAMVYLTNTANKYISIYGPDILKVKTDDVLMVDNIKDNALADISQIKAMNIAAKRYGITLLDDDYELLAKAADEYYNSLSEKERDLLMVSKDDIYNMYYEYLLADTYYKEVIKEINPEISDDEARTITVLHIFFKTYEIDDDGTMVDLSADRQDEIYKKAQDVYALATDGEHEFKDLVMEYSEGDIKEYSFGMNETDKVFENAAFNLGDNEISNIVKSKYGYHIIKCISTFNKEETEANKDRIALERKQQVFGKEYDNYADTLITIMNDELWDSVEVNFYEDVDTQDFFEVYHKYFD